VLYQHTIDVVGHRLTQASYLPFVLSQRLISVLQDQDNTDVINIVHLITSTGLHVRYCMSISTFISLPIH
jgi:hypothetical protein